MIYRSQTEPCWEEIQDIRKIYSLTSSVEPEYIQWRGYSWRPEIQHRLWYWNHSQWFRYYSIPRKWLRNIVTGGTIQRNWFRDNEQYIDSPYMTQLGRQIKRKCPNDYEDLWKCFFGELIFSFSKMLYVYAPLCPSSLFILFTYIRRFCKYSLKHWYTNFDKETCSCISDISLQKSDEGV